MKTPLYFENLPLQLLWRQHSAWRAGIALLLLLYLASQSWAQTLVCGNISGTWTSAGNPYIVTCDATIPAGQTLTILPGVVVWIGSNVTITANGSSIHALGSDSQRITFQAPVGTQYWNTISLVNAAGTNRFRYCDFLNAKTALSMGVYAGSGDLTLVGELMNCTFSKCLSQGIYGEAQGGNDWITYYSAYLDLTVKNCSFSGTRDGCVLKVFANSPNKPGYSNPVLANNLFENLSGTAVLMGVDRNAGNSPASFLNNTIVNCAVGVDAADPWDVRVQNNIFVGAGTAVKVSGALSRTVSYNDFYGNAANFSGYPGTFGQVIIANRNGTPSDILFNIFDDPEFLDPCSLLLNTNSPCIDAGAPPISDVCFTVSRGTALSDLGAFGGPDACSWPTRVSCSPPAVRVLPIPPSCLDQTVTFTATATGDPPLSYQWWFNGTQLPGQTNANLVLGNIQKADAGAYWVVVGNPVGTAISPTNQLIVNDACVDLHMYAGLTINGRTNSTYVLYYTTDLNDANSWLPLATNAMTASGWFYLDMDSPFSPQRFYKAVLQP